MEGIVPTMDINRDDRCNDNNGWGMAGVRLLAVSPVPPWVTAGMAAGTGMA